MSVLSSEKERANAASFTNDIINHTSLKIRLLGGGKLVFRLWGNSNVQSTIVLVSKSDYYIIVCEAL